MKSKSSFERIKELINNNLRDKKDIEKQDIYDEVERIKNSINKITYNLFSELLPDKTLLTPLSEKEWDDIGKELECFYEVKLEEGNIINSKKNKDRDLTWWSNNEKLNNNSFYWNRYEKYLKDKLPPNVIYTLNRDTDIILNNMGNPKESCFDIRGMVVGHVQSGKTGNFAGLLCKAADAGYKFIVIIAGGINNLRNQTQKRIEESFVGLRKDEYIGVGRIDRSGITPICFTTAENDFKKLDAEKNRTLDFDNMKSPVLLVIKKNTTTLKSLNSWLSGKTKNKIEEHAVLVIDDESDYASINTKEENNPTIINKQIRKLLSKFKKSSYVAYTATPYANVFIDNYAEHKDVEKDLFPKDFIYALKAPTDYFGAQRIFSGENDDFLQEIDDEEISYLVKHKKDDSIDKLPISLYEAINCFLINIAIRHLRGQTSKHNSMLIHMSRYTNIHKRIAFLVQQYIEKIKEDFVYGSLPDSFKHSQNIGRIHECFEKNYSNKNIKETWDNVSKEIQKFIKVLQIKEVHSETKREEALEYRDDVPTNAIVIGGASLSRGFTLEGLSISYFIRTTVFYDTLLQMGRWFGYRPGYEDLCKIYLTKALRESFGYIVDATEDLLEQFEIMAKENKTPSDFGLAVIQYPESSLQITARNKQQKTELVELQMNFEGQLREALRLSATQDINTNNRNAVFSLINKITKVSKCDGEHNYFWRNIQDSYVREFLKAFKTHVLTNSSVETFFPVYEIIKLIEETKSNFDIVIFQDSKGKSNNKSIANEKGFENFKMPIRNETIVYDDRDKLIRFKNRKIAAGNAEKISLSEEKLKQLIQFEKEYKEKEDDKKEKGEIRNFIRKNMERPLLMLHILDISSIEESKLPEFLKIEALFSYGICFPLNEKYKTQPMQFRVNQVYLNTLSEKEDELYDEEE